MSDRRKMGVNKRKIKLSLDKFIDLLARHKYILASVYCEGNVIRFAECRTPRYQKTFIVYLPPKYLLSLPKNQELKRLDIKCSKFPPDAKQIKFISDAKGHLLECDLLAVSSETVCMYNNSGNTKCFCIIEEEEKEEEKEEEEEEENITDKLEKDTLNLMKKVDPGVSTQRKIISQDLEEDDASDEDCESFDEEDTSEEDTYVELIFEDDDGELVDEVKMMMDYDEEEINFKFSQEMMGKLETSKDIPSFQDNSLPPEIEEGDISLGIIFVLIDIGTFFKRISDYEKEVISCYDQIDTNEKDIRKEKLTLIQNSITEFMSHAEKRLDGLIKEEEDLKSQLVRLTIILAQSEVLKNRIKLNPKKYGDVVQESDQIYEQTRATIYELNMEILKLRDTADELLSDYQYLISDLMKM